MDIQWGDIIYVRQRDSNGMYLKLSPLWPLCIFMWYHMGVGTFGYNIWIYTLSYIIYSITLDRPIWIWVNYNISLTWIKAIWGSCPLLTMIPEWGRSEVVIIYPPTKHHKTNINQPLQPILVYIPLVYPLVN